MSANLRGVRSPHTHLAQVGVTDGGVAGRQHRKLAVFDNELKSEHGVQIIAVFITLRIHYCAGGNLGRESVCSSYGQEGTVKRIGSDTVELTDGNYV